MDQIKIRGGKRLQGQIPISGAKNAALPLMCCTLLSSEPLVLTNVPDLADIKTMTELLESLGTQSKTERDTPDALRLTLQPGAKITTLAHYDLVRRMRASVLVLGPLLATQGEATVSLPGGCAIGTRPIDLHLMAMEALGAEIELQEGYVKATAPDGLTGGTISFPIVSVGATENALMAASLAKGTTVIENAAREPEIVDLCNCLIAMGAQISGVGTETLVLRGADALHGAEYAVMPDRIEAGTYAVAAAITGGDVELVGAKAGDMGAVLKALQEAGVSIQETGNGVQVAHPTGHCTGFDVVSAPFPGFPTDMQAQFMSLMALADGASLITETIFENRFMHVPEMARMGADVTVHGSSAMVRGRQKLVGAPVMATDLRASSSLVLAGLAAEGETTVNRVYHLDRGYARMEEKLRAVGADIERVKDAIPAT